MGFKAVTAKVPNINQFVTELTTKTKEAGKPAKQDFEKTTSTWEHKPPFAIETKSTKNNIELFVGVESSWSPGKKANASDIYRFVTRGTSKRHALMSPNFSPKTRKGVIGSSAGRGGVIRVSKNLQLPGIESRDFEQAITKKNKKQIEKDIQKSFVSASIKVNWNL